ncbi:MAG: PqqD family protein [Lachnospiraceae bacterium]|nr:PqqD family protein [Lachnospiraceae bacterium]
MKKKNVISKNYLEQIPLRNPDIDWTSDEEGAVTLHIKNKGVMNKIAQKLFKKPEVSHVYMEEIGSFLWPHLNGDKDIVALGELVKEHFGEKAEPLYERLAKYFQILESYNFIVWK